MGGSGRKEKGQGAPGKIALLLPLIQNRGGEGGLTERPVRPTSVIAGVAGSAAAGDRGETERGSRATYPSSHLGRGRPVEVAPRRGTGGNGG
jgi:hypothetical protein